VSDAPKHIVEAAIALNLIYDIVERVQAKHGVTITPQNIADYVAGRQARRAELNQQLGVTTEG